MKHLLLTLLVAPVLAHAITVEVGAGVSVYRDRGNMTWYQEGLPHQLHLTALTAELGLTGDILPGLAWHAGYVYLGRVRTDAVATPDDANYDPVAKSCRGECIARSNFTGRGDSHGVKLTVEPYIHLRGWRLSVEAGAFVYRNRWAVTVYDWVPNPSDGRGPRTVRVDDRSGWRTGPVVGLSVGRGNLDLVWRMYWNRSPHTEQFPAIWNRTQTVTLRYRF